MELPDEAGPLARPAGEQPTARQTLGDLPIVTKSFAAALRHPGTTSWGCPVSLSPRNGKEPMTSGPRRLLHVLAQLRNPIVQASPNQASGMSPESAKIWSSWPSQQ